MLIVTSCTPRMPPHINTVLRYHSGKLPLFHASAKFPSPNGPLGVSDAMSGGTPGRSDATAIHKNGTAQMSAAALAASIVQSDIRRGPVMSQCPAVPPPPPTLRVCPSLSPSRRGEGGGEGQPS